MFADDFLPAYDASDSVGVVVDACPAETWRALMDVDLIEVGRRKPLVGILGAARMLPELASDLAHGTRPAAMPQRLCVRDTAAAPAADGGWILLAERPGESLALGLIGRFWRPVIPFQDVAAKQFRDFDGPGWAKRSTRCRCGSSPTGARC